MLLSRSAEAHLGKMSRLLGAINALSHLNPNPNPNPNP